MSSRNYLRKENYSFPSQGDFTITPKVKLFANNDYTLLEVDINAWFQLQQLVEPPVRYISVNNIEYETTTTWPSNVSPNVMYSALVFYDEVLIV